MQFVASFCLNTMPGQKMASFCQACHLAMSCEVLSEKLYLFDPQKHGSVFKIRSFKIYHGYWVVHLVRWGFSTENPRQFPGEQEHSCERPFSRPRICQSILTYYALEAGQKVISKNRRSWTCRWLKPSLLRGIACLASHLIPLFQVLLHARWL